MFTQLQFFIAGTNGLPLRGFEYIVAILLTRSAARPRDAVMRTPRGRGLEHDGACLMMKL